MTDYNLQTALAQELAKVYNSDMARMKERVDMLSEALERAIITIESECDDYQLINELKQCLQINR